MIHYAHDENTDYNTDAGKTVLGKVVARVAVSLELTSRDVWFGILPITWAAADFWGSRGELQFLLGSERVGTMPFHFANKAGGNADKVPYRAIAGGSQPVLRVQNEADTSDNNYVDLPPWHFNIRCDSIQLYSEWITGDGTTHWITALHCLSQSP